jgi:hypothetical protein
MRNTFSIPQAGVVRAGLLGKVDLRELCLLDYVFGWFFYSKALRATVEGLEYVWLETDNAITELPLLFNPEASEETRRNQLSAAMVKLRAVGLLASVRIKNKFYVRPSPIAESLSSSRAAVVTNSAPLITPERDDLITSRRDDLITPRRDELPPPYITETGTRETCTKEQAAAAAAVVELWNSFSNLPKVRQLTPSMAKKLGQRLNDPFFTEHWQAGIARAAASAFCTGQGSNGWKANLDWFLRPDSLARILEGAYDGPARRGPATPSLTHTIKTTFNTCVHAS